jgi:tripartite-type tricarboxylate transporter receptor subunit TctC
MVAPRLETFVEPDPASSLNRRTLLAALLGSAFATARAEEVYPARPIRLILGFAPGGSTDLSARLLGMKMATILGQPVVVENHAGASGNIAASMVARSAPDGYTLMYTTSTIHGINPNVFAHLPYDPIKDFEPVVHVTRSTFVLLTRQDLGANSVRELIAVAKAKPGALTYASVGPGSTQHLAGAMFAKEAGIELLHVPYKGSAPALTDLMSGQVDMMFDNVSSSLPYIKSGKLRALAVAALKPTDVLPGVPTADASGVPGFQVVSWGGFVVPAKTPTAIVQKLNAAANEAMKSPEVIQRMHDNSVELQGGSPEDFARFIHSELEFWKKAVAAAGVTAQ